MNESTSKPRTPVPAFGGLAVFGAAFTGLVGWVLFLGALFSKTGFEAAAIALVASALAFGLLANALFRK